MRIRSGFAIALLSACVGIASAASAQAAPPAPPSFSDLEVSIRQLADSHVIASVRSVGGRIATRFMSVLVGVVVGSLGGVIGGAIGEFLYEWQRWSAFLVVGWTITGMLIGASIGAFNLLLAAAGVKELRKALPTCNVVR